jgi:hypothetical protein
MYVFIYTPDMPEQKCQITNKVQYSKEAVKGAATSIEGGYYLCKYCLSYHTTSRLTKERSQRKKFKWKKRRQKK